jgi:cell wall-associated NlpC family hydrolase
LEKKVSWGKTFAGLILALGLTAARPYSPQALVSEAQRYLGRPYVWGGASPGTGFDCGGYTQYVYGEFGIKLPKRAIEQFKLGTHIEAPARQAGDLVFFASPDPRASLHVGIYEGDGWFLHAAGRRSNVTRSRLDDSKYVKRFLGTRRLISN